MAAVGFRVHHRHRTPAAVVLLALAAGAQPAKVTGIVDGDTIDVLVEHRQIRIRLNGIDTPEKGQPFGDRARQATSALCFGKTVTIRPHDKDRNGRLVADVILPGGASLNQELVRQGMAWWYRRYAPKDSTLRLLEEHARENRVGLWADPEPLPPWEWRHLRRSKR